MKMLIVVFLTLFFVTVTNANVAFDKFDFSDVVVIVTTHEVINTAWKLVGGQKDYKEVYAFSYFDHKKGKYYVYLPVGANEALVGHEFSHILRWKGAKVKGAEQ